MKERNEVVSTCVPVQQQHPSAYFVPSTSLSPKFPLSTIAQRHHPTNLQAPLLYFIAHTPDISLYLPWCILALSIEKGRHRRASVKILQPPPFHPDFHSFFFFILTAHQIHCRTSNQTLPSHLHRSFLVVVGSPELRHYG
jgi:hypothetical protein